jgi:hypothetical protein
VIPARHSVWIGHGVGAALFLATVLNGAAAYAKRLGLIERESYERYWAYRCGEQGTKPLVWGLGRQCVVPEAQAPVERRARRHLYTAYVVAVRQYERPLKLAKDAVFLTMILLGVAFSVRRWDGPPIEAWPLWGLLASVLVWTVVALGRGDIGLTLAGLRSFSFLPVALLWAPLASVAVLERIVYWCLALALVQCALVSGEVLWGVSSLQIGSWLRIRPAGTLVHPNTLGAFAAIVMGLGLSFSKSRTAVVLLWVAAVVLVAAAGSGLGWVTLVVLAFTRLAALLRLSAPVTVSAATALTVFCLSALSFLTGRPEVLVSATGARLEALQHAVQQDAMVLMLGQGLGIGTNAAATSFKSPELPSDSTVAMLLRQTGLLGLALFYLGLVFAWHKDRIERPFLLAVLLSSLALSITEAFPVNAILGLALARTFYRGGSAVRSGAGGWAGHSFADGNGGYCT